MSTLVSRELAHRSVIGEAAHFAQRPRKPSIPQTVTTERGTSNRRGGQGAAGGPPTRVIVAWTARALCGRPRPPFLDRRRGGAVLTPRASTTRAGLGWNPGLGGISSGRVHAAHSERAANDGC